MPHAPTLRRAGGTAAAEADQRRALPPSPASRSSEQGRAAEAAAVYADALQGETLGPQAPETVEAIDSLSQLLRDGGDAATAAALRERFGCK